MLVTIRRAFIEAIKNCARNIWLSLATVSILLMALFVVSLMYVVTFTTNNILKGIEKRVNISIYFKQDVSEEKIFQIKSELERSAEINSVDYVSRDQALEDFKRTNADEPVIIQSLQEIGDNPLLASLVIRAKNQADYQSVADMIGGSEFSPDISRINYGKNKEIISKLNSIIKTIRRSGAALGIIFSAVSILIIFNTVRMTIYTQRKEIEVKRLVGASNSFIRLPFIFEGVLYGLAATVFSMIILFVTLKFLTPYISSVIPTENLTRFYGSHFLLIFALQAGLGILLGIASSWIAMRKYLKV